MNQLSRNLSKFKLITFDVTDTLLKFKTHNSIIYCNVAKSLGYHFDEKSVADNFKHQFKLMSQKYPNFGYNSQLHWTDWWRKLVVGIFQATGTSIEKGELTKIADKLIEAYKTEQCWTKLDGVDEILNKFKAEHKTIGIISNFDPRLEVIIKSMSIPHINFIINSYDAGVAKPNQKIFEAALTKVNGCCKPDEALHIGNTVELDYIGSRKAGWSSILIDDTQTEHKNVDQNHIFSSLNEFLEFIEKKPIQW